MKLETVQVAAAMTTSQLYGARAHLVMMSDLEPGVREAINAIDSELLARDISRYPREQYSKTRGT